MNTWIGRPPGRPAGENMIEIAAARGLEYVGRDIYGDRGASVPT